MSLHNRLNKNLAKKKLLEELFKRKTVSFYRYVKLISPHELRDNLYREWNALSVFGRIYLADEGINAQLSVPEHNSSPKIKLFSSIKNPS